MRRSVLAVLLILALSVSVHAAGKLAVTFLDVGQGDSILVQFPNGKAMLVDGGPSSAAQTVTSYLKSQGITGLDVLVSTHPHEDHVGGLEAVLNAFPVGLVVDSARTHTSKTYENYLTVIDRKNIPFRPGRKGMTIDIDPSVKISVLWPPDPFESAELNDSSIVLRVTYGAMSFLLPGDASSTVEIELPKNDVRSTFLKVGHHGSRYSSSPAFLAAVGGKVAVISVGSNSYGHPTPETLSALTAAGYKIYGTDHRGIVRVETDGIGWTIQAQKAGAPSTGPPATVTPAKKQPGSQQPSGQGGKFAGSKNSNKFHIPSCRYVGSIKPENLVWFVSKEDATSKGYIPCKVCNP